MTPQRFEAWRRQAVGGHWMSLGWLAQFEDSKIVRLDISRGQPNEARFDALAGQSDLATLGLKRFKLDDQHVGYLTQVPNLRELVIDDGDVTQTARADWRGLSALATLSLRRCKVTDEVIARIAQLPHLRKLTLNETSVTDVGIEALANCRELTHVDLLFTQVTRAGAERLASALPEATIYAASIDPQITDGRISPARRNVIRASSPGVVVFLTELSRLKWFRGNGSEAGDSLFDLLQLSDQLEYLDLRGAPVTDAAIPMAKTLTSLKYLDVRETQVTDAGLAQLRAALPKCQILR
ncbi:MAG TPA: hypothetical protein VG125_23180 [Pirellulales bacterium]|nr:hypothetical protein [Pirellulales bacterium]